MLLYFRHTEQLWMWQPGAGFPAEVTVSRSWGASKVLLVTDGNVIGAGREVLLSDGQEVLLSAEQEVLLSAGLNVLSSKHCPESVNN